MKRLAILRSLEPSRKVRQVRKERKRAMKKLALLLPLLALLPVAGGCGNGTRGWRNIDLASLQAKTDTIAMDIASGRLSFAPRHISASHDSLARGDIPPFSDGTFANHVEAIGDYYYWDRSTVWGAEGFVVFPTSATIPSPLILEPFENVTRTKKIADRIWYCVGGNY